MKKETVKAVLRNGKVLMFTNVLEVKFEKDFATITVSDLDENSTEEDFKKSIKMSNIYYNNLSIIDRATENTLEKKEINISDLKISLNFDKKDQSDESTMTISNVINIMASDIIMTVVEYSINEEYKTTAFIVHSIPARNVCVTETFNGRTIMPILNSDFVENPPVTPSSETDYTTMAQTDGSKIGSVVDSEDAEIVVRADNVIQMPNTGEQS